MSRLAPFALLLALTTSALAQDIQQGPQSRPTGSVQLDFGPARYTHLRRNRTTEVAWRPGLTALQALQSAAKVGLTAADPTHPAAIDAIDGVRTNLGKSRFWLLDVNGQHATAMAQDIVLEPGFSIRLSYAVPPVVVTIEYGPAARSARTTTVTWKKGMTALDALRRAGAVQLTSADPHHPAAVDSIDGVRTDLGRQRFWMFAVNGKQPDAMAQKVAVQPGFEVVWTYTELKKPETGQQATTAAATAATGQQAPSVGLAQALPQ
jgi:hypothetical protein